VAGLRKSEVPMDNKASQPLHAHRARQRLEEQEVLSIQQQTAQQYQAFEAEQVDERGWRRACKPFNSRRKTEVFLTLIVRGGRRVWGG
jgi:hypothetical protein